MEIPGARAHYGRPSQRANPGILLILTFVAFTVHQFLIFLCA